MTPSRTGGAQAFRSRRGLRTLQTGYERAVVDTAWIGREPVS
jgi:hypothetical protein